ncbi:MAG: IPT/TIG domain-containing protein [Candidatus Kapaibacterium sp.]
MKKTSLFMILAGLSTIVIIFILLNFGGCKNSQPTASLETQSLIKIDSFAPKTGFPGSPGYAGTIVKIYGKGFGSNPNRVWVWYGTKTMNKVTPLVTDSILTSIVPYISSGRYPIFVSFDSTIAQSKDSFTVLTNPLDFAYDSIEFHNFSLNIRTIIHASGSDSDYSAAQIWNSSIAMKSFDSSYGNSSMSGDNGGSYYTSFDYTIDTQSMTLPIFEYTVQNNSYSDGGTCLGCTIYQSSLKISFKFKNVPWVYTSDHNIIATITAKDILSRVDVISDTTINAQSNPNSFVSKTSEIVGMNTPASDAYIRIKFSH